MTLPRSLRRRITQIGRACALGTALASIGRAQVVPDSPVVTGEAVEVRAERAQAPAVVLDPNEAVLERSWSDLTADVPNFQVEASGTSSFGALYSLRGLSNTPYFSDPAVSVYFDAIPLGGSFSYPTDLAGMAAASVMAGPHPTDVGRAGDAGVVVFSPDDGPLGGTVSAGAAGHDARSAAFTWSGSQGCAAHGTVAVDVSRRDGYIENTTLNESVDTQRVIDAFAKEVVRPSPSTRLTLEVLGDRHRDGAAPLVPLNGPLYSVERSHEGETDTDLFGAAAQAEVDLPFGTASADTSYTNWSLNPYDDWLVLPPPLASHLTQSQRAWNEEIHLASAGGSAVTWNAGLWGSDAATQGSVSRSIAGVVPLDATTFVLATHDYAAFGNVSVRLAEGWRLTLGFRLEDTEKNYHQLEQVPTPGLGFHFVRSYDAFLPRLALTGALSKDTSVDASLSWGFRPGGFSPYTDRAAYIPFAAERLAALEAGIHRALAVPSVTAGARVFAYAIQNDQIERSFSAADYFVATAPRGRSLGAEGDLRWALSRHWILTAAAGLTDVTLVEFHDPLTGTDYSGHRAAYAPAFTADVTLHYQASPGWFASATVSANGKTYYTEAENPVDEQPAYAVINAQAGFAAARWRISAFIENAAGKGYYSAIIPGVNSASPGVPRTAGVEAALKF